MVRRRKTIGEVLRLARINQGLSFRRIVKPKSTIQKQWSDDFRLNPQHFDASFSFTANVGRSRVRFKELFGMQPMIQVV